MLAGDVLRFSMRPAAHRQKGANLVKRFLALLVLGISAVLAFSPASEASAPAGPGTVSLNLGILLPIWSCIPFAGMLLSIALAPVLAPRFWHSHFGKLSAGWAAGMAIPLLVAFGGPALHEILHTIGGDFLPFMILLVSLYTVSGGILLRGTLPETPASNLILLGIGTLLASLMGTTGASMLMIRPLLRANRHRKTRTLSVVFFIFLVANVGGSLTPLGDPPLFLGFLHGVPFFWTLQLIPQMLFLTFFLLSVYYVIDTYHYRKEKPGAPIAPVTKEPLRFEGAYNFIFLAGIMGAVLLSGAVDWGAIVILGVPRTVQGLVRDGLLVLMGLLSMIATPIELRERNAFSWAPVTEVGYLFIGIFITMIPCLLILKAGSHGAMAALIDAVEHPYHYFWASGALSSFLDNAPTYLTFFSTALGRYYPGVEESLSVPLLLESHALYLKAISLGSVFFGACSYIGNAPNFMVRSIAEEAGTPMPSFFGYIFKYTLVFLLPGFAAISWLFFMP
jgi:Na+/H+ antiporter NhaD/arsenite permease-like protein